MKIMHQDQVGPMAVTYYHWNHKYIIKIELDHYEQTFKVHEGDVGGIDEVKQFIHRQGFMEKVFERFKAMDEDLAQAIHGV